VRVANRDGARATGLPALWRMRECMMLIEKIRSMGGEPIPRSGVEGALGEIAEACGESPWTQLLRGIMGDAEDEPVCAEGWIEQLYEALAGCRREGRLGGDGVWLSTVHAAKGTEHGCVAIAGAWRRRFRAGPEEARRLLYVGMTRARRQLAVVDRTDEPDGILDPLRNAPEVVREASLCGGAFPVLKSYRIVGPAELDLGFAGRGDLRRTRLIADVMRRLRAGDAMDWRETEAGIVLEREGRAIAKLSAEGLGRFKEASGRIRDIRVLGVYGWRKIDNHPDWIDSFAIDRWGVPLCEIALDFRERRG
jgi:ATP-dependent DNA helicase RecQ